MKKKIGKIYLEKDNKNYFIVDGDSNLIQKRTNEISIKDLTSNNSNNNQDKKYVTISGTYDWRVTASEDQCTEEYMQNIINTHFKNPDELSELEYTIYRYFCAILESLRTLENHTVPAIFNCDTGFSKIVLEHGNNDYDINIDPLKDTIIEVGDAKEALNTITKITSILKQYFDVELYIDYRDLTIEFPIYFLPRYSIIWDHGFSGLYKYLEDGKTIYKSARDLYFPAFNGNENCYDNKNKLYNNVTLFNCNTSLNVETLCYLTTNFSNLYFLLRKDYQETPHIFKLNFINKLSNGELFKYTQVDASDSTEAVSTLFLPSEKEVIIA